MILLINFFPGGWSYGFSAVFILIILFVMMNTIALDFLYKEKRRSVRLKVEQENKEKLYFISYVINKKVLNGTKSYVEHEYKFITSNLDPLKFIEEMNENAKNYYEKEKYVMPTYSLLFFNEI